MASIDIIRLSPHVYQVTVHATQTTEHEVQVDADATQTLTAGKLDETALVRQSFIFLLARESNTSILRRFNLQVISHYFPDYAQAMRAFANG